jgi:hypothetical protein
VILWELTVHFSWAKWYALYSLKDQGDRVMANIAYTAEYSCFAFRFTYFFAGKACSGLAENKGV